MVRLGNTRFGRSNEDVRAVQRALIARGHAIPEGATGYFGEQTKSRLRGRAA
ncbi:peptidoglycan-binding protein [Streptomyces sp. SR-10]|uniref:peptidoglycan-binding protein n=1 Tax=Streptomyces sp. SR-10 TaxID=3416442 RepID=UPI003CF8664F